jgi:carotenoid cleavage dioxygenase-like enzyme
LEFIVEDDFLAITKHCLGSAPKLADTPDWIYNLDNPYLHGVYAPMLEEFELEDLPVEGELPQDLSGAYFRNGPNPIHDPVNRYHQFDGDGMVHGVYFRDGKVSYRNKYVQTQALQKEQANQGAIWPGVMGPFDFTLPDFPIKDTANTDVVFHNKDLLALWYNAGEPYSLDPLTLETKGKLPIEAGRGTRTMSAHAKIDWATGEMLYFDYGDTAPFLTYSVNDKNGNLIHHTAIDIPGPRLPHDMAFTKNYAVMHDLPFFHDIDILKNHGMRVVRFHRDIPARFGILPRKGDGSETKWFECEPCFVLHISNCWEEGDWVIMDGCRSVEPMQKPNANEGELSHMLAYMRLKANAYRWRFNLRTGQVIESDIDDLNTEFNKSNPIFHGVKGKYSYHQKIPLAEEGGYTLKFTGLVKYNNDTGQSERWDYGDGVYGSEAPFAPKVGADRDSSEDDGYLVSLVTDSNTMKSECLVFDATDITQGPIARVKLPHRVPGGFHATWVAGSDLYQDIA